MIENVEKLVDDKVANILLSGNITTTLNNALQKKLKDKKVNLTPGEVLVLSALWEKDGVTQKDISERTDKDNPFITRTLDSLEKKKFISRKAGKEDRRSNIITLTAKGKGLEDNVKEITNDTAKECLSGISERDIAKTKKLMNHILNNISKNMEG